MNSPDTRLAAAVSPDHNQVHFPGKILPIMIVLTRYDPFAAYELDRKHNLVLNEAGLPVSQPVDFRRLEKSFSSPDPSLWEEASDTLSLLTGSAPEMVRVLPGLGAAVAPQAEELCRTYGAFTDNTNREIYPLDPVLANQGLANGALEGLGTYKVMQSHQKLFRLLPGIWGADVVVEWQNPAITGIRHPQIDIDRFEELQENRIREIGTHENNFWVQISPLVAFTRRMGSDEEHCIRGLLDALYAASRRFFDAGFACVGQLSSEQGVRTYSSREVQKITNTSGHTVTNLVTGNQYSPADLAAGNHFGRINSHHQWNIQETESIQRSGRTGQRIKASGLPVNLLSFIIHMKPQDYLIYRDETGKEIAMTASLLARETLRRMDQALCRGLADLADAEAQAVGVLMDRIEYRFYRQIGFDGLSRQEQEEARVALMRGHALFERFYQSWRLALILAAQPVRNTLLNVIDSRAGQTLLPSPK